ncbi:MAG: ABC transporter permease [Planctomycetota bacterium]|jgi:oligopeptide transport system permease protein
MTGVPKALRVLLVGSAVAAGLYFVRPELGFLVFGLVAIATPAWFSMETSRVIGAILLGAVLFLFYRAAFGSPVGLSLALITALLAVRFAPVRVLRRFTFLVPSMVTLIYLVALLMYMAPGSPFAQEKAATAQVLEAKRAAWGVPEDPTEFFLIYMKRLIEDFNFGPALTVQGRTVLELLGPAFPVSMSLGILALVFAAGIGLTLGIRAGLRPNSLADYSSMGLAVVGISLPNFVIGACFMILFALQLDLLPVAGWGSYAHLFMPALTLALPYAAYIARLARGGTIEVMQQDFIRTARAKGLAERAVVFKHALKGAILPVVSFLGPAAAGIMTGSFVVETLFNVPGMGQWFVKSAINRDYSVVLGTAVIYFGIVIAFNLLVDLAYAWLDPRVRESL